MGDCYTTHTSASACEPMLPSRTLRASMDLLLRFSRTCATTRERCRMTAVPRDERNPDANAALLIFDLRFAKAKQLLPVLERCARLVCEVQA